MEALKNKLHNRRGASILLALLFFLVCMMAGASILMAAASNAGKVKSNQEEQQKYLTLTSALNLVIDELESVTYVGQYTYTVEKCVHATAWDDDDPTVAIAWEHEFDRAYTRATGKLTGSTWVGGDGSVLPLLNDLEHIFAGSFSVDKRESIIGYIPIDDYQFIPNDVSHNIGSDNVSRYKLELTVNVDEDERDAYGEIFLQTVSVEVKLDATTGVITLTASLRDDPTFYAVEAVLNPKGDWGQMFFLEIQTGNSGSDDTADRPVSWTLDHISKKETTDV